MILSYFLQEIGLKFRNTLDIISVFEKILGLKTKPQRSNLAEINMEDEKLGLLVNSALLCSSQFFH